MDLTSLGPQPHDLTGQVTIMDFMPIWNGPNSSVYLGAWNGNVVAVKVIRATAQQDSVNRRLVREITVWASIYHPNIHPFYGIAKDQAFGPFGALISPWCPNGDAKHFLNTHGEQMILKQRIDLWKGVIEGVTYLHNHKPCIIHGDLKSANVIIDNTGNPRICDFGLARIFLEERGLGMTTPSEFTGTVRYLAPELVISDTSVPPTVSSDIHALGCLGLELVYSQEPYSNCLNNARGQIFQAIRRGVPPAAMPSHQNWPSGRVWPLITSCWRRDPESRPSAFNLGRMLKGTELAFPANILQRIIRIFNTPHLDGSGRYIDHLASSANIHSLRNICLVSRACWAMANSTLYREIWLTVRSPYGLPALTFALNSSQTQTLSFNQTAGGYGKYTKILAIDTGGVHDLLEELPDQIRAIAHEMPNLRLLFVACYFVPTKESRLCSLPSLEVHDMELSFLFSQSSMHQVLSCFQRLSLNSNYSASIPGGTPPVWPRLLFTDLQEVELVFEESTDEVVCLTALSGWIMPRLRTFNFSVWNPMSPFIGFLQIHGAHLRHLTLKWYYEEEVEKISEIFGLCTELRSAFISIRHGSFDCFPPHAKLENICFERRADGETTPTMHAYIAQFEILKSMAETIFPKLVVVKHVLNEDPNGWRDITQSVAYYTGDDFVTVKFKNRRYRCYDGGRIEGG